MRNEWNVGQVLFGIQITLFAISLELAGLGYLAVLGSVIGLAVSFSGLVAKPRTEARSEP
jgi:hypothetical protein